MKATIEIADNLLDRAKKRARERRITLKSLVEESLAATLDKSVPLSEIKPVTFKGEGLSRDFDGGDWERIRDVIYP